MIVFASACTEFWHSFKGFWCLTGNTLDTSVQIHTSSHSVPIHRPLRLTKCQKHVGLTSTICFQVQIFPVSSLSSCIKIASVCRESQTLSLIETKILSQDLLVAAAGFLLKLANLQRLHLPWCFSTSQAMVLQYHDSFG